MVASTSNEPARRLQQTFELYETGVALMRQNLRRRHPDEDEATIARRLDGWLRTRPGAEHGDCPGTPRERQ